MEPYVVWLIVAGVAALAEAISFGLLTVWFVAGALVAAGLAFAGAPLWSQLVAFLVVSIACVLLLRPLALKYRARGKEFESTPVGESALVIERVDPRAQSGRVKTPDGMTWAALSSTGDAIETGEQVRVCDHRSIKLVVERLEDHPLPPASR